MKPGNLVITVSAPGEKRDDGLVGLIGVIIRPVTLEDGSLIKSWCDWWVMIEGKLETWAENNLEIIDEAGRSCQNHFDSQADTKLSLLGSARRETGGHCGPRNDDQR